MSIDSVARDLRYALRRLRSRPIYALITVLTLALGVGGTAAIYSIMQGVLLKPLPYSGRIRACRLLEPVRLVGTMFVAPLSLAAPKF